MEVIPAVDIRGGRCVRLYQGDYDRETVFSEDPVAMARHWERLGAPRLHVVDLDGARAGQPVNDHIIAELLSAIAIPVQVAGGIRQLDVIGRYLEMGADRVVLGTAAVHDQPLVSRACAMFREAVVVAVDARRGRVATAGWREASRETPEGLMRRLEELGVPRFIFTDISRDGTLRGPNFTAIGRLVRAFRTPVIASGGVSTVEHLRRLEKLGVEGAIVGRALYDGGPDLGEALAAVNGGHKT
jgi:phosphoribosylformimino-5-aminoimidazole carboxamide ribotide isomerase